MDVGFPELLLIVGLLLATAAALSGLFHGTVLSISVLSVTAGVLSAVAGVVHVRPDDKELVHVIELALVFTLFSDGLVADRELVRRRWHPPARALVIALPITFGLIALAAQILFPALTWPEALLLAAVLSPTDPVVTSTVVTAERVPPLVRHTLNLESGLNDGLVLPLVLFLLVLATPGGEPGQAALELAGKSLAGAGLGVALAFVAARLLPRLPGSGMTERYEGLYALGLALVAFGLAETTYGNGLIAAFVAGVALGLMVRDLPDAFAAFNENVSAIFQVVTFFLFGALILVTGFEGSLLALVAFILVTLLVARPVAILLAFLRSRLRRPERLFVAWFGPKGVASMLFALFVLSSQAPERTLVFDVAAFAILASIGAHGLTDTVGARWIARRLGPGTAEG